MRPWSPPRAWSCRPTPAPHIPDFPPTDRRQAPPAARCACDSNRTPPYVTRPVHTHEPIQVGRVQSVPAHRGPDCPTRLPTPPPPESGDGVCVPALPASAHPPPPPARPPPPPPPTAADSNVRARNDAGAPRQRVYPVRDAATAAAAAPAAAGGRRGKGSRRRQTCGVAVPAAAPGCHHHPRLPPPPPAAAAAPARHDPLLATSVAAPAAFPRHHPPVEQTCPPLTPGLGGYGARGARRPPRDAATTSRAAQWDAAAAAIRSG